MRRPIHVVISPPKELWQTADYPKLRAEAYKVLKASRVLGGCMIIHPWREGGKGEIDDTGKKGSWYLSPHFHIVGYGWIPKDAYEKTGWIVKNLGLRKNVYATLMYQLSHAGVHTPRDEFGILPNAKSSFHTLTWFGLCSYNKLKVPKEKREEELCPICKQPFVAIVYVGPKDPPEREGIFYLEPTDWHVSASTSAAGAT